MISSVVSAKVPSKSNKTASHLIGSRTEDSPRHIDQTLDTEVCLRLGQHGGWRDLDDLAIRTSRQHEEPTREGR